MVGEWVQSRPSGWGAEAFIAETDWTWTTKKKNTSVCLSFPICARAPELWRADARERYPSDCPAFPHNGNLHSFITDSRNCLLFSQRFRGKKNKQ